MWTRISFKYGIPRIETQNAIVKAALRYGRENIDVFGIVATGKYDGKAVYIKGKYAIMFILENSDLIQETE